jgi:coenzyme F420-0:L-glutamate ligase/coenzyme F420-1:gamma-L-glutamate ligase
MSDVDWIEMFALRGIPAVRPGDDVGALILAGLARCGEAMGEADVLVVAQKIVSKAEGRVRLLKDIAPSPKAIEIATASGKDARKVQAILDESTEIVRVARAGTDGVVIARHRHGWVSANAGIDESNLGRDDGALLLLPDDPDLSARRIAESITSATGVRPGVVITDTFGRPWRRGLVNVAIGLANLPAIVDLVGSADAYGRTLQVSQQAFADEIAAASGLLMLKEAAMPVVVVRGLRWTADRDVSARHYVRPLAEDLFK